MIIQKKLLLKYDFVLEEGRIDDGIPENMVFTLKNDGVYSSKSLQ
jgi:ribosomal-protein-alanine N-acetyltransferase